MYPDSDSQGVALIRATFDPDTEKLVDDFNTATPVDMFVCQNCGCLRTVHDQATQLSRFL